MQNSVITQLGYDISSEGPWKIHCNDNLWKILDHLIWSFGDLSNFMIICQCFVFLKRSTIIALIMVYFWVLTINLLIFKFFFFSISFQNFWKLGKTHWAAWYHLSVTAASLVTLIVCRIYILGNKHRYFVRCSNSKLARDY